MKWLYDQHNPRPRRRRVRGADKLVYRKQKVLQPGEYEVKIFHVSESRSRKTGHDMLVVVLPVKNEDGSLVIVRDYLVFTETSIWKFESFLRAIGLELEDGETVDPDDLEGCTARVQIGIREFEDRTSNYVERWLPKTEDTPAATSTPPSGHHDQ